MAEDRYRIGPFEFGSRLFVGTGKYANFDLMKASLDASGCEIGDAVALQIGRDGNDEMGAGDGDDVSVSMQMIGMMAEVF